MEGETKRRTKQSVKCIHQSDNVRVFTASTTLGEFTVIDYNYLIDDDTEVYYSDRTIAVKPHQAEFKAAQVAVRDFLRQKKTFK